MISRKTLLQNVAGLFVNAKELKERGFKFFKLLVFFRCRVERPRPPLGRIHSAVLKIGVNHAICYICMSKRNINTRKMLWICKIYFVFVIFVFIRVAFEGNNKYSKKVF